MIGRTLAHYRITAAIGEGGMGQVYRATDTKLGRDVALKVLPAELAAKPDMLERFQREARAVAALNHPHIVTIHSVEEAGGLHFLTMELIEGRSLHQLIPVDGLDVPRILEIAKALSAALAAAHDKGIVHRDLKPANVMVTHDGDVKVLDFGLAKLLGPEAASDNSELSTAMQTSAGVVMGTRPYMSPEQVQGAPLDHRTDIFSLGIVLYEMATGRRPFQGQSSADLFASILRDPAPPASDMRADLPTDLSRVIKRCLEKDPRRRIQTARDIGNELRDCIQGTPRGVSAQTVRAGVTEATRSPDETSGAASLDYGFRVAVLTLKYTGSNADVAALADGLSDEIVTGLSRFSYLRVMARGATSRLGSGDPDLRAVAKEIGARYVMEGSLRQAGSRLRVAVQLTDATTGAHLWAETYDRAFTGDDAFALQDDLVPRIVSTVADQNGVLTRKMGEILRGKSEDALTPHEAVLRAFTYFQRVTPEEHIVVRRTLERATREAPDYADGWAMLSLMYAVEFADDFNPGPDPLDRSLAAAQRAVHLAATHALGHYALAFVYFLRKETASFRAAAEKALALNPMDGSVMGILGVLIEHAGESERGCQMAEAAMQLNPNYSGLFRFPGFISAYGRGQYAEALELAARINMPNYFYAHAARAAVHGQLGQLDAAKKELRELLILRPDFATAAHRDFSKWYDPARVERMIEGLRKAGLDVPAPKRADTPRGAPRDSAALAIAVLPFSDMSPGRDQAYLCEGMAEEIMNALVRVDGMRVSSRASTFRASRDNSDLPSIASALSVSHVLEGSVRTSGQRLRITAQLTEVASGFQLWSETFDREGADMFAVQDEIAAGVVEAVKARLSPGARPPTMRAPSRNPEAYRSYLMGRYLRHTKNDHPGARRAFEEAIRLDPAHGPSWVMFAECTVLAAHYNFIPPLEACRSAREALATAERLQGESAEALTVMGFVGFYERRWAASATAFRRAIELQPRNVLALGPLGMTLSVRGESDEFIDLCARAREADPLAAFPYAITGVAYVAAGRPREAVPFFEDARAFEKDNTLALWGSCAALIALGRFDEGVEAAERAVTLTRRGVFFVGLLGWANAVAGRQEAARTLLEEVRARPESSPTAVSEAWLLAALDEKDAAFEVLARAEAEYQPFLYYTWLPTFDPLRADPRFAGLRERLGLAQAPTAAAPAKAARSGEARADEAGQGAPASSSQSTPDGRPTIVVLPFVNQSDDPGNEYFSDGLTEELISDLAGIKALSVISRTSAMLFKGTNKDVRTIGRELGVRYVLEGSVRKSGSSLRITAQLIDAEMDTPLWSEKFGGTLDDVFEVQERVSRQIVRALDLTLTSDEDLRLAERPITNQRAFELYLQARESLRQMAGALDRVPGLLAQAIEIEGETPPLLALKAWSKVALVKQGASRDLRPLDDAEAIALGFLGRPADAHYGHLILGFVYYERGRLPEAVRHLKRALDRIPNDPDALLYLAACYFAGGHGEGATALGERLRACDPLSAVSWMIAGTAPWFRAGRFEESLKALDRALILDPGSFLIHWTRGYACALLGKLDEAARHASFLLEAGPAVPYTSQLLALIDALSDRPQAAIDRIATVDITALDDHTTFHLAEPLALAGAHERALDLIEGTVNRGFYPQAFISEHCPFLAPLRALPRFAPIAAKARERTEAFLKADQDSGPLSVVRGALR